MQIGDQLDPNVFTCIAPTMQVLRLPSRDFFQEAKLFLSRAEEGNRTRDRDTEFAYVKASVIFSQIALETAMLILLRRLAGGQIPGGKEDSEQVLAKAEEEKMGFPERIKLTYMHLTGVAINDDLCAELERLRMYRNDIEHYTRKKRDRYANSTVKTARLSLEMTRTLLTDCCAALGFEAEKILGPL